MGVPGHFWWPWSVLRLCRKTRAGRKLPPHPVDHGHENPSLGRSPLRVHPRLLDCKLINSLHLSLGADRELTRQCRTGERRGFDPGSGRSPRGGSGSPLCYSCLENPVDRGAWQLQSTGSQELGSTEHAHTRLSPLSLGGSPAPPWSR